MQSLKVINQLHLFEFLNGVELFGTYQPYPEYFLPVNNVSHALPGRLSTAERKRKVHGKICTTLGLLFLLVYPVGKVHHLTYRL